MCELNYNNNCLLCFLEFSPYHIGYFTLAALQWQEMTKMAHFEGILTTLVGYFIIGISLVLLHAFASIFRFRR